MVHLLHPQEFPWALWKRAPMSQAVAAAPGGDAARRFRDRGPARRRREIVAAYLLLTPAVVLVGGVLAYPLAWEIWISLTNSVVQQTSATYIGIRNYLDLLREADFWRATANTLGYLVLTTLLKLAVGVAVALLLARPFPGRPLVFVAAFLPWAYPGGLALVGWYWFMIPPLHSAYSGLMSDLRYVVDGWLGEGTWRFLTLVVFNIWRGGSFVGIFLLAALNGIPQDLFDYAALEVRSAWRKFWMVTVPLLRPFLALAAFLSIASAVADLGNVYMQSGLRITYPIVWTQAFHLAIIGGKWGQAAALSLILLPALALILFICYRLFEPLEEGLV
jgi:ABC-type sugar transport system permease subunit